jgi:predicted amidophosphoribosyltransferase
VEPVSPRRQSQQAHFRQSSCHILSRAERDEEATDVERTRVRLSSDTLKHVTIVDDLVTIGTDVTFIDVGH